MTTVNTNVNVTGGEELDSAANRLTQAARETSEAVEVNRNVNKKRAGLNIRVIRGVKKFGDRLGKTASGLLGERGIKLRGIVGATAGLLAVDKLAQTVRELFQGKDLRETVGRITREIIPPLLRETVPAILDENNRRIRLINESKRRAAQHEADIETRLVKEPSFAAAAARILGERVIRTPEELDAARQIQATQVRF